MPKYVVLKTLPHGQAPGTVVELNEDAGRVFLLVEAVRVATPADERKPPTQRPRSREYTRRDMQAVGATESSESED